MALSWGEGRPPIRAVARALHSGAAGGDERQSVIGLSAARAYMLRKRLTFRVAATPGNAKTDGGLELMMPRKQRTIERWLAALFAVAIFTAAPLAAQGPSQQAYVTDADANTVSV